MLAPQSGYDFCTVSIAGGAQHALGSPAISKSGVWCVPTLQSKGCRLKPKIPIFETEPHVFIKANACVKNTSPDKAAGIGNIHQQVLQRGVAACHAVKTRHAEHVNIGKNPVRIAALEGPVHDPKGCSLQPVVGIQEKKGLS